MRRDHVRKHMRTHPEYEGEILPPPNRRQPRDKLYQRGVFEVTSRKRRKPAANEEIELPPGVAVEAFEDEVTVEGLL